MGEEGLGQRRVAGYTGQTAAGRLGHLAEVGGVQVGQFSALDVAKSGSTGLRSGA